MTRRLRRAGARWRLLVHEYEGRGRYGTSHSVEPNPRTSEYGAHHELPGNTEFDELVVGRWLHVEQMSDHVYWMDVAGLRLTVRVDRDGRPQRLMAELDDPQPGCEYVLDVDLPAGDPT